MNKEELIKYYEMEKHPEGGAFKESYRSKLNVKAKGFDGERASSTAIFFLLAKGEISALHKIKSDELWHFYLGDSLTIVEITKEGQLIETILGQDIRGNQKLQYTVRAGHYFGAYLKEGSEYALVGCTVSPGFDFNDFEMADRDKLIHLYPQFKNLIKTMTYELNNP